MVSTSVRAGMRAFPTSSIVSVYMSMSMMIVDSFFVGMVAVYDMRWHKSVEEPRYDLYTKEPSYESGQKYPTCGQWVVAARYQVFLGVWEDTVECREYLGRN